MPARGARNLAGSRRSTANIQEKKSYVAFLNRELPSPCEKKGKVRQEIVVKRKMFLSPNGKCLRIYANGESARKNRGTFRR